MKEKAFFKKREKEDSDLEKREVCKIESFSERRKK